MENDAETGEFKGGEICKLSTLPSDFRTEFKNSREAIKNNKYDDLKKAVKKMKETNIANCLDVCEMVPGPKTDDHPMTLLAFAGYFARKEMMEHLISEGAHLDMGDQTSGTPLLQMLHYAQIQEKPDHLDINIVHFFTDKPVLERVLSTGTHENSTALEMSIKLHRFDIVQKLLEAGADPINGGNPDMSPIFLEYVHDGTNEFIKTLIQGYQKWGNFTAFVDRLCVSKIFSNEKTKCTARKKGRNAVHALLLCGDEKTITLLLEKKPDLLNECDPSKKMALHVAAEKGDLDSVKILLHQNADIDAKDANSMTPLKLAERNGHEKVVEEIERFSSRKTPMAMWSWALQYERPCYFEALHLTHDMEQSLMKTLDNDDNTIAHLAAEGGHVSVFKSTFPNAHGQQFCEILMKRNKQEKTPLQLAIENGNIGILNTLQEKQDESTCEKKEKWKKFWDSKSPELMLYACKHGTVDIVKYFVTKRVSPTCRGEEGYTPLSRAAEAGNHDIVAYLLSIKGVSPEGVATIHSEESTDGVKQFSPLMLASKNGHAKCVTLLLEKNANFNVKEGGYNCLMKSIEAGHEDVAIAILKHPWTKTETWKETMRCCPKRDKQVITPMRMLIEHMPDVAKMVLTKCITKDEAGASRVKQIIYDYEFIEDYCGSAGIIYNIRLTKGEADSEEHGTQPLADSEEEHGTLIAADWGPKQYFSHYHPLSLMVKHKRQKLLQHPLISRYIEYKWWRVAFSLFLLYTLIYALFLMFLTIFALTLPRPGPDDMFCPSNHSGTTYSELNLLDGDCREPDGVKRRSFTALAVILILMSIAFLMFEVWSGYMMRNRRKYLVDYETVIRMGKFILTILFAFGFWNDCWCAPPWQWQIGALAIFLAYINVLLLLKGMPMLGVPINMLINIIITFLKLVYLPILLVFSFAIPFYMLFVRDSAAVLDEGGRGTLIAFSSPSHSIAKTIMQTAGDLDFEAIFNQENLLYSPMAYILFISFVVLMPILFSNLLVGLAVGTTETDLKKAEFTNIALQVNYVVGLDNDNALRRLGRLPHLKYREKNAGGFRTWWDKLREVDYATQEELMDNLYSDAFVSDEENKETVKMLKEKVTKMTITLQEKISALERSQKQLQETLERRLQETLERNQKQLLKCLRRELLKKRSD